MKTSKYVACLNKYRSHSILHVVQANKLFFLMKSVFRFKSNATRIVVLLLFDLHYSTHTALFDPPSICQGMGTAIPTLLFSEQRVSAVIWIWGYNLKRKPLLWKLNLDKFGVVSIRTRNKGLGWLCGEERTRKSSF